MLTRGHYEIWLSKSQQKFGSIFIQSLVNLFQLKKDMMDQKMILRNMTQGFKLKLTMLTVYGKLGLATKSLDLRSFK